jgi:hypothetical protein
VRDADELDEKAPRARTAAPAETRRQAAAQAGPESGVAVGEGTRARLHNDCYGKYIPETLVPGGGVQLTEYDARRDARLVPRGRGERATGETALLRLLPRYGQNP